MLHSSRYVTNVDSVPLPWIGERDSEKVDRDERLLEVEVDDCDKRRLEVDLLDLLRLMVLIFKELKKAIEGVQLGVVGVERRIPGPRFNALVTSATFCFSQMSPCRVARSGCSGLESGRFG